MATTQTQAQTQHGEAVVLKKYGNRRIYDTTCSRYVTLGEVEAMVQQGKDIVVTDAKTGEDITKEILVQLLLERDGARAALPMGLLKQAVRLANSPLKEGLVKSLQEGLDTFLHSQRAVVDAQRAFSSQLEKMNPWLQAGGPMPLSTWNPFAPPPPSSSTTSWPSPSSAPSSAPPSSGPGTSDVDSLRAELVQTQHLVQQLLERELARDQRSPSPSSSSSSSSSPSSPSPSSPSPSPSPSSSVRTATKSAPKKKRAGSRRA
jgi:polyhydroxyalkanoate synthesis repressor PhaR